MRHPQEGEKEMLTVGLEPTTYRLQGECSTVELCQQIETMVISNQSFRHKLFCEKFKCGRNQGVGAAYLAS